RDERLSWVLAEVFALSSEDAASVLEVDAATHRKRLSRAREKLGAWMGKRCGLVDLANACRCARQVPVATGFGVVNAKALEYAGHPERGRRALPMAEVTEIERAADVLRSHPDYAAPGTIVARIREI